MTHLETLQKLQEAVPKGIFKGGDFLTYPRTSEGFSADGSHEMITAKVIEWLSRAAFKTERFNTKAANDRFHKYHLDGINAFCGTSFTEDDMENIYTHLGNAVHHQRTLDFIRSGYDMSVLTRKEI